MKKILCIVLALFLFSSCSYMDTGTDKQYLTTMKELSVKQTEVIIKYLEARAIQDEKAYVELKGNAAGLLAYNFAMQERDRRFFEEIQMPTIVKPKSWVDVADRHAGVFVQSATLGFINYQAFDMAREAARSAYGDMSFAGDAQFNDSFNATEVHQTGTGEGSSVWVPYRVTESTDTTTNTSTPLMLP